ncbi:phospholipid/cholesterol/gamma-HCH transport system substrate-binding protein [Actinocorallia herbida]|uniref:Phospholipid/cholesterol/gamma-HCH transport system substrate-binding protein n=1 Tax=Actinocorallia herbida TaxID=58109 RepID=A0A3N1D896_9ACTN|nr:MlaD family protein [Actinocorallia herbida]ROO89750.1 phospholipid/cholesterol/gamma-HCH transport system substrate-binding protein [Actinocorallia herbida]
MALPSLRDLNRRIVALVSLSLLIGCIGFAFLYGQVGLFQGGYHVTGVFTETGGLKEGDDVRLAGVKVGKVTAIDPDFDRGKVRITFRVESGIDLGPQTRADVQLANLLGGRYLKLTGPVQEPYLADLSETKREIPEDRTGTPYTVVAALNKTTGDLGRLDMKSITRILEETEKIDLPSRENLNRLLTNVSTLNAALNAKSPQFQQLIADANRLTGVLATKNDDLARLLEASQTLLETLTEHRDELASSLGNNARVVDTLADVVGKRGKELDDLLANLHTLTRRLEPRMADLNTDLALLGPTFQGLANAGSTGDGLAAMITGLGILQGTQTILPPEARP